MELKLRFHPKSLLNQACHYSDVIMSMTTSQITCIPIVCSTICPGADQQRKRQSSASLAFVRGIHQWLVDSPHKGPVTQKIFSFDDIIMQSNALITTQPLLTLMNIRHDVTGKLQPLYNMLELHGEHDDVIKWKHFPRNWPFVRGIHQSPVNSPHKGQWSGALMFSLICVLINNWVNNRGAGDLRHFHAHYDATVMGLWIRIILIVSPVEK